MFDYDFCQTVEFEFLVGEQINHICIAAIDGHQSLEGKHSHYIHHGILQMLPLIKDK